MLLVSQTKTSQSHIIMYNTMRGLSIDKAHNKSYRWVSIAPLLACIRHGVSGGLVPFPRRNPYLHFSIYFVLRHQSKM